MDDFYEQLLKIKEKYSFENIFLRKIEEVTEKYKYYAGYDIARVEMEKIKCHTYIKIVELYEKNHNTKEVSILYNECINKMNNEIIKALSQGFTLEKQINDLKSEIDEINDDEIVEEYINLKTNFDEGQLFSKTNDEINMIEEMIVIKDHIVELRSAIQQNYIKQFVSEKDVHKKLMITSTYNEVFDYIKSLKNLSRIKGIASMLEDKDYVRVIILIKLYIMKDDLEKMKQNNDSDYKKRI